MNKYYLPAEWQEQVAVQLTWPHADTDWAPYLDDIVSMELNMVKEISKRERVIIATPEPYELQSLLREHLTKDQQGRVEIYHVPTNDTWARDHAAITLLPKTDGDGSQTATVADGATAQPLLLDFKFNGWGEKFVADKDNEITMQLAKQGAFESLYPKTNVSQTIIVPQQQSASSHLDGQLQPLSSPRGGQEGAFILEGGSIESDGKGTVFTTSCCLLAPHRNQPLTREEIEAKLKEYLHCERVVWIDHGELIGDDTDGHIDTTVRPAPDDTLLYVKCQDENDEQYADFVAMEEQLKTFRTLDGKPYRLLPLPMPRPMYDDGDRLPATYANFLIINGAVLVPTYGQPDLDAEALSTIQKAFPDREVVGIDAQVAVRQHGSLHCLTMQFPAI